jgi:anti-sigma regulatory factor (Ser/Thr protein kinase)
MAPDIDRQLPPGAEAVAQARHAVDELAPCIDGHEAEVLRLVVSELVTNAIRHGASSPQDDPLTLQVSVDADRARVEVTDPGRGFEPPVGGPSENQESGWGLLLVDALCDRWGVDRRPRSRVWAELRRARTRERHRDQAGKRPGRPRRGPRGLLTAAGNV